ncbi:MAG: hypothetical protein EA397_17335 [Deltaproteobacteria bacterium]|nr:MAG: hypothetical protein EA397_17335 [Deltaproteobacteria bacterium]
MGDMTKPTTREGYRPEHVEQVRATCLYVATFLGDLRDDLVVIGGLVPSLIIDQGDLPEGADTHVGTMDLDVGLTVALLDGGRYRELTERLRYAGFEPDTNLAGNLTRQRWRLRDLPALTMDFLIPPSREGDRGGRIRHIEADFAALIAPGLSLAFRDRVQVHLDGRTIRGERAARQLWVCGPGAYVVLKALAFDLRGENKDAYDLFYVLRNYGRGPLDVATALRPLLGAPEADEAVAILQRDFIELDGIGARRVAAFLSGGIDEAIQADVVAFVGELLEYLGNLGG